MILIRGLVWVVRWIPLVAGLDREVPAVPLGSGRVDHILAIGVEAVSMAVGPVLEVIDEEVPVTHAEEAAGYTLAVLETLVDGGQQFSLAISLAEDVFMGPGVPIGDSLASYSHHSLPTSGLSGALMVSLPMSTLASRVVGRASRSGLLRTASMHSWLPPT